MTDFNPGSMVHVRGRDWVVLPSNDDQLLLIKPMDGSDDEITGLFKPLDFDNDQPQSTVFPKPKTQDMGNFATARLLFNAARLSLRNAAGPFRCMGKLSFRPRAYQLVPLIMALRQPMPVRLLIADDVGVGKTIEALIVLKELLERGDISRFAIITPPHLCEQWQRELKEKFGIDAVIIRSNTQARLDREVPGDTPVFQYYPFQVISIDYIKSPARRQAFLQDCPEFCIVDEAHTCSRDGTGRDSEAGQQRHALISMLSARENQHLVLLTATPHSGKQDQFNSLLALVKSDFRDTDLGSADRKTRSEVARYFVQRRRGDVERWLGENTPFPRREAGEFSYELSPAYAEFYKKIWSFILGKNANNPGDGGGDASPKRNPSWYWSALTLLRGVMSSPGAGAEMLRKRAEDGVEIDFDAGENNKNDTPLPLFDDEFGADDYTPADLPGARRWTPVQRKWMKEMMVELTALGNTTHDLKARAALEVLVKWLENGFNAVVFCKYIATANYLGNLLKNHLPNAFKQSKKSKTNPVEIRVITSEVPDEVRKERIAEMAPFSRKILVATDCLSEGVNLQDQFTAVLHYDLPWNPNRLEQRDGRVDRYGQQAPEVKTFLLLGERNPIDETVYNVLLKKIREIHRTCGISVPFSGESITGALLESVLAQPGIAPGQRRLEFGPDDPFGQKQLEVSRELEKAANREKYSRSIFAQHAIKADEIEADLKAADRAVGDPDAVESFTIDALRFLGAQVDPTKKPRIHTLHTHNMPDTLTAMLPHKTAHKITFFSPGPADCLYLGRNHPLVEQLCRHLSANALNPDARHRPARAAVMFSPQVNVKTTLVLLRVRTVIKHKKNKNKQPLLKLVSEEMTGWGYRGMPEDNDLLAPGEVDRLMATAQSAPASAGLSNEAMAYYLDEELRDIDAVPDQLRAVAAQRARELLDAHQRFYKVAGGPRFEIDEPLPPMDLMGIYILLPDPRQFEDE